MDIFYDFQVTSHAPMYKKKPAYRANANPNNVSGCLKKKVEIPPGIGITASSISHFKASRL
jgi:hypothetical protein